MAENDSEKTVKLNVGANPPAPPPKPPMPPTPSTPSTPPPAAPPSPTTLPPVPVSDQTVMLPAEDKTVKLQAVPPPPSMPEIPEPPMEIPSPPKKSFLNLRALSIALPALALALGAVWYFLPPWLRKSADSLAKSGGHAQAAQRLRLALALFPLKCDAYLSALGREQRLSKDLPAAQKSLEKVLSRKPDQADSLKELGLVFKELGQDGKALEAFKRYAEINSGDGEALRWIGALAFDAKDYATAAEFYDKASKSSALSPEEGLKLGRSHLETGKNEAAWAALLAAAQDNPGLKGVHALLAKIHAGKGEHAQALSEYKLEFSLAPEDPALSQSLAESAWLAGKDSAAKKGWSDAISYWQEGLRVPSQHSGELHYELSRAFAAKKDRKRSLSHLAEAAKADPSWKKAAKNDAAFNSLKKLPQFRKITR